MGKTVKVKSLLVDLHVKYNDGFGDWLGLFSFSLSWLSLLYFFSWGGVFSKGIKIVILSSLGGLFFSNSTVSPFLKKSGTEGGDMLIPEMEVGVGFE